VQKNARSVSNQDVRRVPVTFGDRPVSSEEIPIEARTEPV